ncbi:FxsA family membrane protein [Streptomyces sp. URMC 123]|uniref:FxsA family membrane protein n=1 Tax=Streptomyces sp. URMC 123 TaxID=3423403 RepID=UPI003F1DD857
MTTGAPHPTPSRNRPRRSRARTLVPLGIVAWVVLEVWLLSLVADAAGGLTVFLLLLAGVVLGAIAIKRAGRRAWRGLTANLQRAQGAAAARPGGHGDREDAGVGGAPASGSESGGTTLPMLGGLLLMVPGLLSDVAGLLCLFPPTRALLRRRVERSLERRMRAAAPGGLEDVLQQARIHRPDGKVVPGEVVRDEERGGGQGGAHGGGAGPLDRR